MKTKLFSLALLLMITAAGVWAQDLPNSIWTSPQSDTTLGRYRSYADDFIRPDYYSGVKFDKWLGLVSFKSNLSATAGFATKIKDVYIGAIYLGNFWTGAQSNNYTEEQPITVPSGGTSGTVYDVYPSINVTPGPVNNVAVLIGVANMGFRLTFRTNYQRFNEDGIVVGTQLYNNYHAERGYLTPQIAWAMAKDLTKNGIRPYATFELGFDRDYIKTETVGPDSVSNIGAKIERSQNHIDPTFTAGLGGYTLYNKDGFKLSADFDYILTFNIYNNEYSYDVGGVYRIGNIKGTYDGTNYLERFFVSNTVTPSLAGAWSKDRLALKFKLNLPLVFNSKDENSMVQDTASHNLVYSGDSKDTFTFTFRPDLRLAMQYKIIPDRLTLNAGARLQASLLTAETTDITNYSSTVSTSKKHNNSMGTSFTSGFNIGFAFNLTENFWTEFSTGISNTSGYGAINLFDGNLFVFANILVGLKF